MPTAVAVGYVNASVLDGGEDVQAVLAIAAERLAVHAHQTGVTLTRTFADASRESERGFYALLAALRRREAATVVIPHLAHLRQVGCLTGADARAAQRYLRVRLLIVHRERDPGSLRSAQPGSGGAGSLPGQDVPVGQAASHGQRARGAVRR